MATPVYHYQNQLQFNPEVHTRPLNMAVKFHQPQPIVIEKFSHSLGSLNLGPTNTIMNLSQNTLHLSTVSEDQLSIAVQLAKRDLKKQKEAEAFEKQADKVNKAKAKGKTAVKSRYNKKPELISKIHKDDRNKEAVKKKPGKQNRGPTKAPVLQMKENSVHIAPAQAWKNMTTMNQEEYTLQEIKRLKSEMDNCITQMKKIEEIAKNGKWVARAPPGTEDLPEEEIKRRRALWAEQQDIRSSRVIYTLQQQVKAIQADLTMVKPPFTQKERRSFLQRVVATYRKSVRGLQTLVNQLVDYDLSQGLPRPCHEFQVLMKQLALCTAQLDLASTSQVPDSIKEVFHDILKQAEKTESPFDDSLLPNPSSQKPPGQNVVQKDIIHNKPNNQSEHARDEVSKEVHKRANLSAASASPDRAQALRQGIEALVRATDSPLRQEAQGSPGRPQARGSQGRPQWRDPSPPERPQWHDPSWQDPLERPHKLTGRNVSWEVPLGPKQQSNKPKKGLLLPHGLQARRKKLQRQNQPQQHQNRGRHRQQQRQTEEQLGPMHYAEPTVSSQLRAMPPQSPARDRVPRRNSPARVMQPGRDASSERAKSPRRCTCMSENGAPVSPNKAVLERGAVSPGRDQNRAVPYTRSPRLDIPWKTAQRQIQRQVWLDKEVLKHAKDIEEARKAEIRKLKKMKQELLQPTEWVTESVDMIREQLQPILDQSKLEMDAEDLADVILQDVLDETVTELQRQRDDEELEQDALLLMNAPSLETMMQKLREMEEEQASIRQRWATIVYEEKKTGRRKARFYDTDGSEQPRTPPPLEIKSASVTHQHERGNDDMRYLDEPNDVEPLIFTRTSEQRPRYEVLHLSSHGIDAPGMKLDGSLPPRPKETRVPSYMPPDIIDRIKKNEDNYQEYLKRSSQVAQRKFDPWNMVEKMTDEILDECLVNVAKELEDINTDIANNIYESEFKQVHETESNNSLDQSEEA